MTSHFDPSQPEVRFAIDATLRGARLAAAIASQLIDPALSKSDRSPVTVADYAVQAAIAGHLSRVFPADPLVAEEDTSLLDTPAGKSVLQSVTTFVRTLDPECDAAQVRGWIARGSGQTGSRFWTLDPIDGTKGFLRGEQYAVALALVEEGEVKIGVLGCPRLDTHGHPSHEGSIFVAVRGQGCWSTPVGEELFRRVRVSDVAEPERARLLRSVEAAHTDTEAFDQLVAQLGSNAQPVYMDSQAKYAVLAAGAGELLFRLLSPRRPDYREKIWDQAAGSLINEEAGGKVTDLKARPLDFSLGRQLENNRGVVASNGLLHPAAIEAIAELQRS